MRVKKSKLVKIIREEVQKTLGEAWYPNSGARGMLYPGEKGSDPDAGELSPEDLARMRYARQEKEYEQAGNRHYAAQQAEYHAEKAAREDPHNLTAQGIATWEDVPPRAKRALKIQLKNLIPGMRDDPDGRMRQALKNLEGRFPGITKAAKGMGADPRGNLHKFPSGYLPGTTGLDIPTGLKEIIRKELRKLKLKKEEMS